MVLTILAALLLSPAFAAPAPSVDDWVRAGFSEPDLREYDASPASAQAGPGFTLSVVLLKDSGWTPDAAEKNLREVAEVFAQCGVRMRVRLAAVRAPEGRAGWKRRGDGPDSVLALHRAVPFLEGPVAFLVGRFPDDEEAAFSRARWRDGRDLQPELYDTVYITDEVLSAYSRAQFDLSPYTAGSYSVSAHELLHVFTRLGGHLYLPERNLLNNWDIRSNLILPRHCSAVRSSPLVSGGTP
ncbi:MAG: hypothetical protein WC969_10240 [Elusimicrobiota bacterium]|jgi:hypothetical protein